MVPNFETTRKFFDDNGMAWEGEDAACKNEKVKQAIRTSITHAANSHKVPHPLTRSHAHTHCGGLTG